MPQIVSTSQLIKFFHEKTFLSSFSSTILLLSLFLFPFFFSSQINFYHAVSCREQQQIFNLFFSGFENPFNHHLFFLYFAFLSFLLSTTHNKIQHKFYDFNALMRKFNFNDVVSKDTKLKCNLSQFLWNHHLS